MTNLSRRAPRRPGTPVLAKLVLIHFSTLLIFTSWAFGGQAPWARQGIAAWGTVGVLLFIVGCFLHDKSDPEGRFPALQWLWPLWLYDLLVVASCFNPGFKSEITAGTASLVMANPVAWLPSAAIPSLAAHELWQFNVFVLSCFNLWLVLRTRQLVRVALFVMAGNGIVLAVLGTFQKLVRAKGLWFGLVPSPNEHFFSTFIYHNHWGAFTVLNVAVCLGLIFHYLRRGGHRDLWHSPLLLGLLGTLLLAASVPLSSSRSSTVLVGLSLAGALGYQLLRLVRARRARHESAVLPVAGITLAAVLAVAAIGYLGRDVIAQRLHLTAQQISSIEKEDTLNSRLRLYRDTWRMAAEKPWFGWGLESYAHVFPIFNTQRAVEARFWITFYAEAHNDWLQSLAEVGFIGTACLGLLLGRPVLAVPWRRVESVVPRCLLAGNCLILIYAWLEFPLANPAVVLTFFAVFYCAVRYALVDLQSQQEDPA